MNALPCSRLQCLLLAAFLIAALDLHGADDAPAPFPGKKSVWNGYDRYDFQVGGKNVLVVVPKQAAPGKPWVWHGEFFGHKPAPDIALLGRGFHIVYLSVPNLLGCPDAVAHWNKTYAELTGKYGFAKKAALVGLSRGGLYCYNWASANPDKVAEAKAKPKLAGWFAGQVMKATQGKANPQVVNAILRQRLGLPDEG